MLKAVPNRVKRRNVEKRREKSRYAARSRREKEAGIFTDLYVTVPIVSESTITHVDRIAVLRLAATLCRVRHVAQKVFPLPVRVHSKDPDEIYAEANTNECLDGFLLVIDSSGLIIYISPTCSRSLGLTQTDLIGRNFQDYLHVDDSLSLAPNLNDAALNRGRALFRLKCVLSPRGRNLTLKSAVYKPVSFAVSKTVVEFPPIQRPPASRASPSGENSNAAGDVSDFDEDDDDGNASHDDAPVTQLDTTYYIMYGLPLVHCGTGSTGDYHGHGTFVTRHTMDMKFSYCHERSTDYLGYDSKSLMNSSFFSLVHPEDLPALAASLKELYRKGHASTGYYRLMVKSGGYIWVMTAGNTVTHSTRGHGGQYIACVHQLVSGEETDCITADVQQTSPSMLSKMEADRKTKHSKIVGPSIEQLLQRAPTVTDYIPLPNPNAMMANVSGMKPTPTHSRSSVMPKSQAGNCHQDWLFRAVGSIEACDAGRGLCISSDAATRTAGKRVDAAARNTSFDNCDNSTPANGSKLLSAAGSFGTNSQADHGRHMFTTLPPAGVRTSPVDLGKSVGQPSLTKQTEDLSSLAPFIHHTDEILTLDFGQNDIGVPRLSPSLIDGFEFDFTSAIDCNNTLDDAPFSVSHIQQVDESMPDPTMEKLKIESIYRYLRDDSDGYHNELSSSTEPCGLPPLIVVEPTGDQNCPTLISSLQPPTPPYGVPVQQEETNWSVSPRSSSGSLRFSDGAC